MDKVSLPYLFSFPRYQTKCVNNFLFRHDYIIDFEIYLDQPLKQWLKISKFQYLENEKSFLDKIKNIFHSF